MRAIVTGGHGFIGYNLCKFLAQDFTDWDILVIDDLSSGKWWNKIEKFDYIYEKVQTTGFMEETIKRWQPSIIFHLSATPRVAYSVEHPFETCESNLIATLRILEAIKGTQTRLINTSSSSIYGHAELPTQETAPANPLSPYAMQKWQAEEWCRMYAQLYDVDVLTIRPFNVFGPYSYYGGAYSTVLSAWLYTLYVDPHIRPFLEGDGTQSRDFCYIDNVVQAYVAAATVAERFYGESFNIAQGTSHTLLECKDLLEQISGKKLDLELKPPRKGDVPHTLANISSARSRLKYKPETDFENQVKAMAEWYQSGYLPSFDDQIQP